MTETRISKLESLPLFHDLRGRKAVVVGSSGGAEWKAELLEAAGARVLHLQEVWSESDLDGAAIAIADLSEPEAARFAHAARSAGALINIVDQPGLSDFAFGSIVNRSPVVIGISTSGAAPMLGQSIRGRIEAMLPAGIARWGAAAKAWRPRVRQMLVDFGARRAFWKQFVDAAWAGSDDLPTIKDFNRLIAGASRAKGRVTLVGAGPGDPDLLTLKALRALQSATVILHDHSVGPEILELARREARRIPVGKVGHGPSCKQDDINRLIVELARAGDDVVRLKGGDPMIFGRAAEEIDACRSEGIEVRVIPGISAAQGAAASLLVSLTERGHSRRVQFITGHGADGTLPADIDWASIADPGATTIIYMPRRTLDDFVRQALARGLDPATPAIAIASATLPEESLVAGPIAEIGAPAETLPAGAPVAVIVGWVARRHVTAVPRVTPLRALAS